MGKFSGVLLASDLDGTLLDSRGEISAENIAAIRHFTAEGGLFAAATGRSPVGFVELSGKVPANAPAILGNGAVIYDYARETVVYQSVLTGRYREFCAEVLRRFPKVCIEAHRLDCLWALHPNEVNRIHVEITCSACTFPASLDEVPDPWIKALLLAMPDELAPVSDMAKNWPEFSFVYSTPYYLEMQGEGVDKGKGVTRLAQHVGVAHEHVYTAGDNYNDLPMLEAFCSFCPQNAPPDVRVLANHVVSDCDHHAIAAVIARLEEWY